MRMKFINFETSIDLFHRFFSKKLISENVNNLKSKRSFLNFNNNLTKTLKKIFRNFFNDLCDFDVFEDSFKRNIIIKIVFRH